MENGCKEFSSSVMDRYEIDPYYQRRLDDIAFLKVKLRMLNNRGLKVEDTMGLIDELYEYIHYLYTHIEQLEKDKQYLLEKSLKKEE